MYDAERQAFRDDGYVVLRRFFEPEEMGPLAKAIVQAGPKNPLTNRESQLNSGPLRFYSNTYLASQEVRNFVVRPEIIDLLYAVTGVDLWIRWDQAVMKGPGAPVFAWHQDNGYNHLDVEHFQFWIALSGMNADRGGLWLIPGSHKRGVLPHERIKNHMVYTGNVEAAVCIDAEPGDVVLFSSKMLHYTGPNVTQLDRLAYVVEYMDQAHHDPGLKAPFFLVSTNGKSDPRFVDSYAGSPNPMDRKGHLGEVLRSVKRRVVG